MLNTITSYKTNVFPSLLLIILAFLIFSCENNENLNSQVTSESIPKLLERSKKIRLDKEWDMTQNFYASQVKTLKNNSEDPEAKLNLAQLFVKEARVTGEHGHYYPAALKMCDEILQDKEISKDLAFRTLTTKAGVQLSLHEFKTALETGKKALALNNQNAQIYGVLVDANVELGKYKKAVAMADKMISIKPDLRSYSRISYLREIHGDIDGAKQAMQLAVDAGYPGYEETAWTMLTLGDIYKTYGEPEKADIIYQSILKERVDYPFAVGARAQIQADKGNYAEAEKLLKEAISIIPEVGFYVQRAEIYKLQTREDEYNETMKEIFEMLEDDEASGHNMNLEYVHIYIDLEEDVEKAMAYAKKEYEKRPENIDVNMALAEVYLMKNDTQSAMPLIKKATRTGTQRPEYLQAKNNI